MNAAPSFTSSLSPSSRSLQPPNSLLGAAVGGIGHLYCCDESEATEAAYPSATVGSRGAGTGGIYAYAQQAEARAAEAQWRALNTEAAVRRDADAAFAELQVRAHSDAARLRVRLQAAENYSQQQAQQLTAMRGVQTRATAIEAENEKLRRRLADFDKLLAEERAKTMAEADTYHEAALEEANGRLEACESKLASMGEANARMKKQLQLAADRQEKIESLEKANAYLRSQRKEAKQLAAQQPRRPGRASTSPSRQPPSPTSPTSTASVISAVVPGGGARPPSPLPTPTSPTMSAATTAATPATAARRRPMPVVTSASPPAARAKSPVRRPPAGKAAGRGSTEAAATWAEEEDRLRTELREAQEQAATAAAPASAAGLSSLTEEAAAAKALRQSNERLRCELLQVTEALEQVAPWRSSTSASTAELAADPFSLTAGATMATAAMAGSPVVSD
mmetsp:Transcript_56203/g.143217  ORF Transcript_56203/g.143217 Transcript_56203/m.143217 type:complete len:451 (+) Transcript_56203:101-1453(+)